MARRRRGVAARAASAPAAPPIEGRHLLLVDGEPAGRARTARYFRTLGWTVAVAGEGGEEAPGPTAVDLAIVDLGGAGDGTQALALVSGIKVRSPRAAVVVVAGAAVTEAVESELRALGATEVVRPPAYLPDLGHLALSLTGVIRG
jgi:CheY-like chemotaxis protein